MRSTARSGFALAGDANLGGAVHACRDFDRQLAAVAHAALAAALLTGDGDHRTLAAALVASRDRDHVEDRGALPNFAQAAALRAAHRVGARLGACAAAGRAALQPPKLDVLLGTEDRLLEA